MDSSDHRSLDTWLQDADRDLARTISAGVDIEVALNYVRQTAAVRSHERREPMPPWRRTTVPFESLVNELKTLRKGRGLFVSRIGDRVGPALRKTCGIVDDDGPAEMRRKVAECLESLASGLPPDLRIALMAAYGIDREARLPLYQERVQWVAAKIHRDSRTTRRRIDEAIDRIADLATPVSVSRDTVVSAGGWHTEKLKIWLALDQPVPEAIQVRHIVAERDGLTELELGMTVAPAPDSDDSITMDVLEVDVFQGGTLIKKTLEPNDRVGLVLALPEELRRDQRYEVMLRYRLHNNQMEPHFFFTPKHGCNVFELHVRFDQEKLPAHVWRVADAFRSEFVDSPLPGETLQPDGAGEISTVFHQLAPRRAYGVRWTTGSECFY